MPRVRARNFKSKSGTGDYTLLVPLVSEVRVRGGREWFTNFGNRAPDAGLHSACPGHERRRSHGDRQVRIRSRRLPFLGDGLQRYLACLASAVAGADRLGRPAGGGRWGSGGARGLAGAPLPRRPAAGAAARVRSGKPAALDAVAAQVAAARYRGG